MFEGVIESLRLSVSCLDDVPPPLLHATIHVVQSGQRFKELEPSPTRCHPPVPVSLSLSSFCCVQITKRNQTTKDNKENERQEDKTTDEAARDTSPTVDTTASMEITPQTLAAMFAFFAPATREVTDPKVRRKDGQRTNHSLPPCLLLSCAPFCDADSLLSQVVEFTEMSQRLFERDYDIQTIDNSNGNLCQSYPPRVIASMRPKSSSPPECLPRTKRWR